MPPIPPDGKEADPAADRVESLRDMLRLLAGPSLAYFDAGLDSLAPPLRANLSHIGKIALARIGEGVADAGGLPPRAAECLLNAGSHVDDPLAAVYWGGVLASSRTRMGRDDRGVRWLKLLERLTNYQLRAHYLLYATLRRLCLAVKGRRAFDFDAKRYRLATFLPAGGFARAMRLADDEMPGLGPLVVDALTALGSESLLDGSNTGNAAYLRTFFKSAVITDEGIVFAPGIQGIRLFLWAFGAGDRASGLFTDEMFDCRIRETPDMVEGSGLVYDD